MSARVLVCDDAPGFRLVMTMALESADLETLPAAESWSQAIEVASAEQPDAIVTDLWMPTYEPQQLERLCAASPDSLIFVVSVLPVAQATEAVAGVAEVAGIYSKPAPPHEIAAHVQRVLAARDVEPAS